QLAGHRIHSVSDDSQLDAAIEMASKESVWIMMQTKWTKPLVQAVSTRPPAAHGVARSLGNLVLLKNSTQRTILPPLQSVFRTVVGYVPEFRMLPAKQLAEVLASESRGRLFIGGIVDKSTKTLTLIRGDLRQFVLPLSFFRTAGPSVPNFDRFKLGDYGQGVIFGDYEASTHSVLFGIDPEYRRWFNRQRVKNEQGFGSSLRRLRLLRGLSRNNFPGVAAKTIARIERGETEKPHGKTLRLIAEALNVEPDDIESY
ncbi:MAG TPA: helix-turn-helix transcriptional regulator, partial [Planctomycetaceae bacterium]|nr:helix-turn-helix transcriptional regulator [Planctomycetaceae bacterium]